VADNKKTTRSAKPILDHYPYVIVQCFCPTPRLF